MNLLANYIDYTAEIPSSLNRSDYETNPTRAAFTWAQAKGYEANKYTLLGLSDRIGLQQVFLLVGFLPAIGLLTVFLPDTRRRL